MSFSPVKAPLLLSLLFVVALLVVLFVVALLVVLPVVALLVLVAAHPAVLIRINGTKNVRSTLGTLETLLISTSLERAMKRDPQRLLRGQ